MHLVEAGTGQAFGSWQQIEQIVASVLDCAAVADTEGTGYRSVAVHIVDTVGSHAVDRGRFGWYCCPGWNDCMPG